MNVDKRRKEVYKKVYESTNPIRDLIDPEDVDGDAGSWSEVSDSDLDREIHESVKVQTKEGHYENLVINLAIAEWLSDLPRVQMEHLVFDTHEEALQNGYWPYKLSTMGAEAKLHDIISGDKREIPNTARNRAHSLVHAATADKLDPRVEEPEY